MVIGLEFDEKVSFVSQIYRLSRPSINDEQWRLDFLDVQEAQGEKICTLIMQQDLYAQASGGL